VTSHVEVPEESATTTYRLRLFVSSNWHFELVPQLGTSKLFEVFALSLPTELLMSVRTKKLSSSWHQSLFLLQLGISVVATFASPIIFFFRI
jgi:hypothetical protein